MAEAKIVTDANGIVTTPGRFQGRHINDVMDYLEGLEEAVTNPDRQPPARVAEQPPAGADAAAKLEAQARNRIDPLQQQIMARLEQDDESEFAGTVSDYAKYKEAIDKLKQNIAPQFRTQKGLHRTLYINVKSGDKRVSDRIFEEVVDVDPDALLEEGEEEAPPPSPGVETPPKTVKVERPAARPKAAPPMAKPTPASRQAPPAQPKKSKLVATDKVKSFCRATGQDVDKYLLRLESEGMSQDQLDNAGQMGKRENPRSVYDRTRAARS